MSEKIAEAKIHSIKSILSRRKDKVYYSVFLLGRKIMMILLTFPLN